MFALLVYNTCVAPMSTYCANNILQYGMDVAKYNVMSNIFKYLMREVTACTIEWPDVYLRF